MSSNGIAIRVSNLSKCYEIYEAPHDRLKQFLMPRLRRAMGKPVKQYFRNFSALNDVSFEVKKGETVGIIGRNGAGKSTLLQIICGTLTPTNGAVEINGRVAALLELGAGFNGEFTGRENVYMNAGVLGLSVKEIDESFNDIISFADIGDFIDQPVKTYSSGMYVRLAFSVVVHVDADILIVDEALSVGDAFFQAKCMSRMKSIVESGATILFVSHDINTVKALCSRTLWLDYGNGKAFDETSIVASSYAQDWIKYANKLQLVDTHEEVVDSDIDSIKFSVTKNETLLRYSWRHGTGDAQYQSVQGFCNGEKVGLLPLNFGSTYQLICDVEIMRKCKNLVLGIHVKERNNQHLVGFNTGNIDNIYDQVWEVGEKFQVEFNFPLRLQSGAYSITALISTLTDTSQYSDVIFVDWLEDVCVFDVAPRNVFPLSDWVEFEHEIKFSLSKATG